MPADAKPPTLAEFAARPLLPGDFYHTPEGYLVFTEQYHRRRGYCCGSGCRHCPWKKKNAEEVGQCGNVPNGTEEEPLD